MVLSGVKCSTRHGPTDLLALPEFAVWRRAEGWLDGVVDIAWCVYGM